jgi:hypothetical protein
MRFKKEADQALLYYCCTNLIGVPTEELRKLHKVHGRSASVPFSWTNEAYVEIRSRICSDNKKLSEYFGTKT